MENVKSKERFVWLAGSPMRPSVEVLTPLPTIPGIPFLYRSAAAIVVGPAGAGRSTLVQACAYDAAGAGLRIAYLGSEVTEAEFDARAADLATRRGDAIDESLHERLAGVRYLDLASVIARAWSAPETWTEGVPRCFDVVLVDPLSAVAAALGLDFDKSNAEFGRFYIKLVQPIVRPA